MPTASKSKRLAIWLTVLLVGCALQSSVFASRADAMSQDTRTLVRGGTYGLIGGTVVGLAVLPLTGSVRGVFIGSSLGLYMGIIMGVYHVTHRDDPNSPFRGDVMPEKASETFPLSQSSSPFHEPTPVRVAVSFPILSF